MKTKTIFFIVIFLTIILHFNFVISAEETTENSITTPSTTDFGSLFMGLDPGKIFGTKDFIEQNKIEDGNRFSFVNKDASLTINGNLFTNVAPKSTSNSQSYIEVDKTGLITKASFTVNEKGGDYVINGLNFHAPPNAKVFYDPQNGFKLSDQTKITSIGKESSQKISGNNISFLNELIFNGKLETTSNGYLISNGIANYNGMKISADKTVLIAKNPLTNLENYKGNWIKQTSTTLEFSSVEGDSFNIEFLKDNQIFDMKNLGKLKAGIGNGDGLKITKGNIPEIFHKSSEKGYTEVISGDSRILINKDTLSWNNEWLNVEEVLAGQYKPVSYSLISDSEKLKINNREKASFNLDSTGKGLLKTGSVTSVCQSDFSKEVFSKLNDKELLNIAQNLKANTQKYSNDYLNSNLPKTLSLASITGFNKAQSMQLFNGIINITKDSSYIIFNNLNGQGYNKGFLNELKVNKDNSDKTLGVMLKTIKSASDAGHPEYLGYSNNILLNSLEKNINLDLAADYIDKSYKLNSKTDGFDISESDFLKIGVAEYTGNNFEQIKRGISVYKKYGLYGSVADSFDLKCSSVMDEKSLANEFSRGINEKMDNGMNKNLATQASQYINAIHDKEDKLYKTDSIRQNIAKSLSLESKYYLISSTAGGGTDLMYSSTFDAISNNLPTNFIEEIKKIDPEMKDSAPFVLHFAEMGKLDEIMEKDDRFFIDSIKKNLDVSDISQLQKRSSFLTDAVIKYYNVPGYENGKEELQKFLIDKYNSATSTEMKATYGYLLKLEESQSNILLRTNKEALAIDKQLPQVTGNAIPEKWLDRKELSGTMYFYDDETSFESTKNELQGSKYGMRVLKNEGNKVILIGTENGKTIKFTLEKIPKTGKPDNKEIIENDKDILVAHRGHSYHLEQTFSDKSNAEKIFYLGSCSSYASVPNIQAMYPNSQLIAVKGTGREEINNAAIYEIFKSIANGKSDWSGIESSINKYAMNTELVLPNDPSLLINKYILDAVRNDIFGVKKYFNFR